MAVWLTAKTVRQEVVYGAYWVGDGVVGYCVERQVLTRVGLGAASLAVGMTSVVVVVAVCIMGAEVFVRDGPRAIRGFVKMLATGWCLLVVYLTLVAWMDDCWVVVRIEAVVGG